MALRGQKPGNVQKRLKLMMYGPAGIGKTTAAIQFPRSYVVDCERGTENYGPRIEAAGGVVYPCNDMDEIVKEVRSLATERHDYRTLVIDPVTTAYDELLQKCERKVGSEWGRHIAEANKVMKRLFNAVMALDMNVIVTCHQKREYAPGGKMEVVGETFDGWKSLDYVFDLVLQLSRDRTFNPKAKAPPGAKGRFARVAKTRIDTFPDGDVFEWSYEAVKSRYDASTLERQATAARPAEPEQVAELNRLLEAIKLPEGTVEKWLSTANVEGFEDMPEEYVLKCIDFCRKRLPPSAPEGK